MSKIELFKSEPKRISSSYANQSSSENSFLNKLERHLTDLNHGIAEDQDGVVLELNSRKINSSQTLSKIHPKSGELYLEYQTALNYQAKSRFIRGVSNANSLIEFFSKVS